MPNDQIGPRTVEVCNVGDDRCHNLLRTYGEAGVSCKCWDPQEKRGRVIARLPFGGSCPTPPWCPAKEKP